VSIVNCTNCNVQTSTSSLYYLAVIPLKQFGGKSHCKEGLQSTNISLNLLSWQVILGAKRVEI